MNKEQAQQRFLEQNLQFLTSGTFDKKTFKRLIKETFIDKHKKKFGIPKQGDVCEWIVQSQVRAGIKNETMLEQIDLFPIYKDIGSPKQNSLRNLIDSNHQSGLADAELEAITNQSVFDTVASTQASELRQRIEKENEEKRAENEQLEKQLQQKREENESLPSVLDAQVPEEPDFDPAIDEAKSWWEEFYLRENPFPGQDGLSKISQSDYEGVVVKTPPYESFIGNLNKGLDFLLNSAFMLVGKFGYGKTTFQDYLSYYLTQRDVLPIRVKCFRSQADCNGYLDAFTGKLIPELKKYASNNHLTKDLTEREDVIVALCKDIGASRRGIVIMLDDYHKFQTSVEPIYEFLGNLQLYKDELVRQDCSVGFIVSALPKWKTDLSEHQQMSGFFDSSPIVMSDPTPDYIHKIVNNRIKTYCWDSTPRQLDIKFVRHIFEKNGSSGSYRDYLNLILDELNKNGASLVSSPIDIDKKTLEIFSSRFKSTSTVHEPLQKLIKASGFKKYSKEQVNRCLEILVSVHNLQGVEEEDKLFADNTFYFSRLKELGLVSKRRIEKQSKRFKWVVSKSLARVVDEIEVKDGYKMSDYFLKLFAGDRVAPTRIQENTLASEEVSRFRRMFNEIRDDIEKGSAENIERALSLYDRFEISDLSSGKADTIQNMKMAMESASAALFSIDSTNLYFERVGIRDLVEQWRLHHHDHEAINEFYDQCNLYSKTKNIADFGFSVAKGKDCFMRILSLLEKTIQHTIIHSVDSFQHLHTLPLQNLEEKGLYAQLEDGLYTANRQKLFECVNRITDHLEIRMRQYLYVTSVLVFGKNGYDRQISDADKGYAHKNLNNDGEYTTTLNLFAGFTRSQYRNLFCAGGSINTLIIKRLDLSWTNLDRELFYKLYGDQNIKTAHQKIDSFSQQQRATYVNYCRLGLQLLNALNAQMRGIILNSTYLFSDGESAVCRFSFALKDGKRNVSSGYCGSTDLLAEGIFLKDDLVHTHVLEEDLHKRVSGIILSNLSTEKYCFIDLSDYEFITQHYSVSYEEFVLSLSHMVHIDKVVIVDQWFGSQVVVKTNSDT